MKHEQTGSPDKPEAPKIKVTDRRRVGLHDSVEPEETPGPEDPLSDQPVDDLTVAKEQAAAYLDDLQRLKAEFENFRKRAVREQTEIVERASVGLIRRLLTVLDNFELAVAAAEETRDTERILKGVEMVFGELKEVLFSEGLAPIDARGRPFDPHMHEAALEVAGDGEIPVVAEVLRPGYTFKGKVLRPAMVKVARAVQHDEGGNGESP